jgi:hypothetical protein
MKNFALLDENNIVTNISIADESWDSTGWIEYTEENPAVIGGDYVDGYFYSERPFASWTRDKGQWICPKPKPEGEVYWSEEEGEWLAYEEEPVA